MTSYHYDIEIFPNYACFTFIPAKLSTAIVKDFIDIDIELLSEDIDRFDYESNEDLWLFIQKEIQPVIFEIGFGVNTLKQMVEFLTSDKKLLIGYNNSEYDDVVLDLIQYHLKKNNGIIKTDDVYRYSKRVIGIQSSGGYTRWSIEELSHFESPYLSMDLMRLNYLDKNYISLKQVSISLKWYKVQDYDNPLFSREEYEEYHWANIVKIKTPKTLAQLDEWYKGYLSKEWYDRPVLEKYIPGIQLYNINDVLITKALHGVSEDELKIRFFVTKHWGIPLSRTINASRSALADLLLEHFYSEFTGYNRRHFKYKRTQREVVNIGSCIFEEVTFLGTVPCTVFLISRDTPTSGDKYHTLNDIKNLNDFLNHLKSRDITDTNEVKYVITINNTDYTFASGGLHSKDRPGILSSTDNLVYRDADVTSYYPSMVINKRVKPEHLTDAFIEIARMVVEERKSAKKLKDNDPDMNTKAEVLKIVANAGFFGKFGAEGWLKDMMALVSVTFNGELQLLMFIELLEAGNFIVVNANTDGVITIVPRDRISEYMEICKQWEDKTGLNLEYTDYKSYFRKDVNHYIALTEEGKIKRKGGEFNPELDILKGYSHPVVSIAVEKYFIEGKDFKETILNHTDILDFCISQKVGKQYVVEEHKMIDGKIKIKQIQRNIRYYVSNGGSVIMKRYKHNEDREKLVKNQYCTVINNLFYVNDFKDYNVNYNFYFAQANKIIQGVYGQLNLHRANSKMKTGRLFD